MANVHPFPHQQVDSPMPEHVEAELYVLGDCVHNPKHIPIVRSILQRSDFYRPAHELIWDVLGELYDAGQPTEPLALRIALEKRGDLKRAGGTAFITGLADYYSAAPEHYAELVRAAADLRAEVALGNSIIQQATAPDAEPGGAVTFIDDYLTRQKERAAGRSGDPADALLAELLDASSLDNMPTLEPLVGDLLHRDTLARIIGPSGHMKSFVVIDIAAHVGTGTDWHGHRVQQGTVVYLVAEGARGIRKRVRAWEKHHGLKMDNVLFMPRPIQTRGPEWDVFIEAMRRLEPALIVIDTQARVSVGVEENSNTELGIVVERMDDLRRATEACVLVIHHTGHIGEHGRGASAAKGALQSEMHVSKKGENASNLIVTMKVGKQKDDEEGPDLQFGLKVVTLDGEYKADGRPVTSVVLESLDMRPRTVVEGTAEWMVAALNTAGIPLDWGQPRVTKWLAGEGIPATKRVIEDALRIRKANASRGDITGANTWSNRTLPHEPVQPLSDCARNNLPGNLPAPLPDTPPRTAAGRSGEDMQNPSSDIPQPGGEVAGSVQSEPSSPSPIPRDGEVGASTTPTTPHCTICNRPLDPHWANRGYDTHLGCDPRTGSHPDAA